MKPTVQLIRQSSRANRADPQEGTFSSLPISTSWLVLPGPSRYSQSNPASIEFGRSTNWLSVFAPQK